MSKRADFLKAVESHLGAPVLWAAKGPDAFDCSGLVTTALWQVGGPDLRHLANAQALHDHTRALGSGPTDLALPGDLAFYGADEKHIIHVATLDEYGGIVSADGATSHVTDLHVALANPANRVRRHDAVRYRRDTPYVAVHRNVYVDDLDKVSR